MYIEVKIVYMFAAVAAVTTLAVAPILADEGLPSQPPQVQRHNCKRDPMDHKIHLRCGVGALPIVLGLVAVGGGVIAATQQSSSPTAAPTSAPTAAPTSAPTAAPTAAPTSAPTAAPTAAPTMAPTAAPTAAPTSAPTQAPTAAPTAINFQSETQSLSGVTYPVVAALHGANLSKTTSSTPIAYTFALPSGASMTATVNTGYPSELTTPFIGTASYTYSKLTVTRSTDSKATVGQNTDFYGFGRDAGLQYTELGLWALNSSVLNVGSQYLGTYAGALSSTATVSVPTSGTANYTGLAVGTIQNSPSNTASVVSGFSGNVTLNADFGAGTINGNITSINAYALNVLKGSVNNIGILATISGTNITGTTNVTGAAGSGYDITGATGKLVGAFAGPTAQEVAGVFNLSGGTNNASVIGAFGAKNSGAVASDSRLKHDIVPAGALPNGIKLHAWRYLGGRHRFIGVMAQDLLADPRYATAVETDSDGLMRVDYAQLGFTPADFDAMVADGEEAIAIYRQTLQ